MDAVHDTIITITLPGVGTIGSIVAQRGDLAQVIAFPVSGRNAIEQAIDCALVALEQTQMSPPPVFPDPQPEVKPAAPAPKKAKKQKVEKPKLDVAPSEAPAPRVEQPKAEKPVEAPAKPKFEQLSLF